MKAHVEPKTVTIGTPFRYIVDISAPKNTQLVVPVLGERFGDFFVTDFGDVPPHADGDKLVTRRWFKLVSYTPGDETIPGFPIKYRLPGGELQDASAGETVVIVDSLLAKEPKANDIRDIAPPVPIPWDWRPTAIAAGGVLALAALVAGVYLLVNRRRRAAQVPPRPAHEVALEALARLRAQRMIEAGRFEEYYVSLSSIVRTYAETRFGLRAPEMTTEEFLVAMQRDRRLTGEQRSMLGDFLAESDLVKFARHHPAPDAAERAYAAARRFIEESRPEEAKRAAA